jgi:hypothetical protein
MARVVMAMARAMAKVVSLMILTCQVRQGQGTARAVVATRQPAGEAGNHLTHPIIRVENRSVGEVSQEAHIPKVDLFHHQCFHPSTIHETEKRTVSRSNLRVAG